MGEDWDFYFLRVDDEPASIYLDIGLARRAPIASQPQMAYVRVFMRQPRPDGLSSNEEYDDLVSLEDALTMRVTAESHTTYAGRNTSGGNRDFYFYTSDPEDFSTRANLAMSDYPHYRFEVGSRPDPDWTAYFGFLYPSPDDLQRLLNRRVTRVLTENGDDLSKPRPIAHFAYLPSMTAAENLRRQLLEQGFSVDEPHPQGEDIALSFKGIDRPEVIDAVVVPLARLISELGGTYDGWGCEAISQS